jgi:hypothetical protein
MMKIPRSLWISCVALLGLAVSPALLADDDQCGDFQKSSFSLNPRRSAAGAPTVGSLGSITPVITYHGGALIGTPTVYVIWYGNWNQANGTDTPAGQQIVRDFLQSVGGSPYYNINTTYSVSGKTITGNVVWGGETTDTGSKGTTLTDTAVRTVIANAITAKKLPNDANGIYLLLSSSNIAESSGFCSRYCGWHTYGSVSGTKIRYSFVGNAARCLNGCAAQTVSPNGNAGVDGMLSVIAHELEEATTDPDLNGWYDSAGAENGDKCAWTFGATQVLPNGAYYNMTLGSRNYLIQRNLKIVSGVNYCVIQ